MKGFYIALVIGVALWVAPSVPAQGPVPLYETGNVLAVGLWNDSNTSSDVAATAELSDNNGVIYVQDSSASGGWPQGTLFNWKTVFFDDGAGAEEPGWQEPGFDDSGWTHQTDVGFTIGHGGNDGENGETLLQTSDETVYTRSIFDAVNLDSISELTLKLEGDDGAVAWLNGVFIGFAGSTVGDNGESPPDYGFDTTMGENSGGVSDNPSTYTQDQARTFQIQISAGAAPPTVTEIDFSAGEGYSDGPLVDQPVGAAATWVDGDPATGALTFEVANEAMVITPDGVNDYWVYLPIPNQNSGMLIVTWDWQYVGPEDSNVDVGFMLSDVANFDLDGNPALTWNEQSCMVRMQQESNVIDVRNGDWEGGGGYEALEEFPYTDGKLVSMRMEINLDEQTYDVYAQKEGEAEVQLADDFGFRRAFQDGLNAITLWDDGDAATSSVIVDNIVIGAGAAGVGIFQNAVMLDDEVSFGANTPPPGSATEADGVYTIVGSGEDVWQKGDEAYFIYNNVTGNGSISAKVRWISAKGTEAGGNDWGKIGVMIREVGDDPNSTHYWIEMRCGPGDPALGDRTDAQWRETTGGDSGNVEIQEDGSPVASAEGIWLRVSRKGSDQFMSEYSYDGANWNLANEHTVAMQEEAAYGIICTAHTEGTADKSYTVVAEASDVKISPAVYKSFAEDYQLYK